MPIIALTAHADEELKRLCAKEVNLIFQKPLTLTDAKQAYLKLLEENV